jgi:hypothetical protein
MLVDFGKAGWIDKARQQPDKVRMVLDKIRTDGLLADGGCRVQQARPAAAAGLLQRGPGAGVGAGVTAFAVGDRVISATASMPRRWRAGESVRQGARIRVSDDEAAFTVLGAIGLQGIRLGTADAGRGGGGHRLA